MDSTTQHEASDEDEEMMKNISMKNQPNNAKIPSEQIPTKQEQDLSHVSSSPVESTEGVDGSAMSEKGDSEEVVNCIFISNKPGKLTLTDHVAVKDEYLASTRSCCAIKDHSYSTNIDDTELNIKEESTTEGSRNNVDDDDADHEETTEGFVQHNEDRYSVSPHNEPGEKQNSENMRPSFDIMEEQVYDRYLSVPKGDISGKPQTKDVPTMPIKTTDTAKMPPSTTVLPKVQPKLGCLPKPLPKITTILVPKRKYVSIMPPIEKLCKLAKDTITPVDHSACNKDSTFIRENEVQHLNKTEGKIILSEHCKVCSRFFTKDDFLKHMKNRHPGESAYKCKVCGLAFVLSGSLKEHEQIHMDDNEDTFKPTAEENSSPIPLAELTEPAEDTVTSEEQAVTGKGSKLASEKDVKLLSKIEDKIILCEQCKFCKVYFTKEGFLKHMQKMHPGKSAYICKVCGQTCALSALLKDHELIHLTDEKESAADASPFICFSCNQTFTQVDGLTAHICNKLYQYTLGSIYKCNVCYICYDSKKSLSIHKRKHSERPHQCTAPGCKKAFKSKSHLLVHQQVCRHNREKSHTCKVCGKSFCVMSELIYHNRKHTGEKPYVCHVCGKSYPLRYSLTVHMRGHAGQRNRDTQIACEVCGKVLSGRASLYKHNFIHTGEKPYQCKICGKGFNANQSRKNHERTHTGLKPFQCKVCGKAYTQSNALRLHNMMHTGKCPYKCDLCGRSFAERHAYTNHCALHTGEKPFVCELCGMQFAVSDYLKSHIKRLHSDKPRPSKPREKQFLCQVCGKSFLYRKSLIEHTRLHTGETPYECAMCNKKYCGYSAFLKHRRVHHNECR